MYTYFLLAPSSSKHPRVVSYDNFLEREFKLRLDNSLSLFASRFRVHGIPSSIHG